MYSLLRIPSKSHLCTSLLWLHTEAPNPLLAERALFLPGAGSCLQSLWEGRGLPSFLWEWKHRWRNRERERLAGGVRGGRKGDRKGQKKGPWTVNRGGRKRSEAKSHTQGQAKSSCWGVVTGTGAQCHPVPKGDSLAGRVSLEICFWPRSRSSVVLMQECLRESFWSNWTFHFSVLFPLIRFYLPAPLQWYICMLGFLWTWVMLGRAFQLWGKSRSKEAGRGMIIAMQPRSAERRPPLPRLSF